MLPGLLPDWVIRELAMCQQMINPYYDSILRREFVTDLSCQPGDLEPWPAVMPETIAQQGRSVISYGGSSYGYDLRVKPRWKVFTPTNCTTIDPKNFDPEAFVDKEGESIVVPPHSFVLAESVEKFRIPRDVLAIVLGKSTYARTGCIVNITPAEPAWNGILTIEISNTAPLPLTLYANEGIAQMLFFRGAAAPHADYQFKRGRYQNQVGLTLPIVEKIG